MVINGWIRFVETLILVKGDEDGGGRGRGEGGKWLAINIYKCWMCFADESYTRLIAPFFIHRCRIVIRHQLNTSSSISYILAVASATY